SASSGRHADRVRGPGDRRGRRERCILGRRGPGACNDRRRGGGRGRELAEWPGERGEGRRLMAVEAETAQEPKVLAARLPGPPELLPGSLDAIIDLQTD